MSFIPFYLLNRVSGVPQKHHGELFPPVPSPSPDVLAQAALFIVLRDHPLTPLTSSSPWTTLSSRRFGGDVYERVITFQSEDAAAEPIAVHVQSGSSGHFNVTVHAPSSERTYANVPARLASPSVLATTLESAALQTTIVSQQPPASVPASTNPHTMERLHVFHGGQKTTLLVPSPKWLMSLGGDVLGAARGALRAPMPSVVVEVRVRVGDRVEKGQPVVVLESMKTETVLRALVDGVVSAVGCKKGEMVEEGRELVDIAEGAE